MLRYDNWRRSRTGRGCSAWPRWACCALARTHLPRRATAGS